MEPARTWAHSHGFLLDTSPCPRKPQGHQAKFGARRPYEASPFSCRALGLLLFWLQNKTFDVQPVILLLALTHATKRGHMFARYQLGCAELLKLGSRVGRIPSHSLARTDGTMHSKCRGQPGFGRAGRVVWSPRGRRSSD